MAFRFSFENPYFEGVDTTSTTKVKMFDNHKAREQVFNQENLQLVNQYYNYMKFTEKLKNNTCNTYKTDIYEWFDYIVMYQDNKNIKKGIFKSMSNYCDIDKLHSSTVTIWRRSYYGGI